MNNNRKSNKWECIKVENKIGPEVNNRAVTDIKHHNRDLKWSDFRPLAVSLKGNAGDSLCRIVK